MAKKTGDFSSSFKELEELASWFEHEQPDLDKGLQKFERAMELASQCREQLSKAEQKIQEIKERFKEKVD
ncbi:MAG: exodeoxyribonuclease VII small subunit [Candidatus Uhrbacteria bacterium]|nr:exodeoxyribonuclease VII small subunit [Candidatus Uhrbacteria bacterium]